MGQTLSEPIVDKHSTHGEDDARRLAYGASCMQGWRLTMEDAHTTLLKIDEAPGLGFFAVFDGHGGRSAAVYCGEQLHSRIIKDDAFGRADYATAIKNGFLGIDMDLRQDPEFDDMSGCTAVVALITPDDRIFVGNAGDSRAVMSINGVVKPLSFDHKPANRSESARIVAAGGFVEFGRVNGNLALSRAIGDFEFKQNMNLSAEQQVVTANPDILEHRVAHEEDEFVVLACDGIWDCMSSQSVVDFVREHVANGESLATVCEKLMDQCLARENEYSAGVGYDNMTVMVVALLGGRTLEEWYAMIRDRVKEKRKMKEARIDDHEGIEEDAAFDRQVALDAGDEGDEPATNHVEVTSTSTVTLVKAEGLDQAETGLGPIGQEDAMEEAAVAGQAQQGERAAQEQSPSGDEKGG
ncbi:uncharacterized protein VTP21DRAFT_3439 [Calcarisporiella thermophila]|uniref:uncharacterized protein n=1 Tax=Calcarisporiella thermophila TaxID=911321 RepID=UPI003742F246